MSYHGKRAYAHHGHSREMEPFQTLGRVLLFPLLLLYLELVLHIYMKTSLSYLPVYLVFSVAGGLFCGVFTLPWHRLTNRIVTSVLAVLISLVYIVEIIAKKILQSYYPLSTLGTAAGNRLTDYSEVVASTIFASIPIIILVMLPSILICVLGGRLLGFERFDIRFAGLVLAAAAIFHVVGLGVINLPWKGDLTPKQLYQMDTNIDDQVEQLGMWTMLRLDVKHMFIKPARNVDADFSGLGDLGGSSASSSGGDTSLIPLPT